MPNNKINLQKYISQVTFKVGDIFECLGEDYFKESYYILSQTGMDKVQLIGLKDGNRWDGPFKVENPMKITTKELEKIMTCEGVYSQYSFDKWNFVGDINDFVRQQSADVKS